MISVFFYFVGYFIFNCYLSLDDFIFTLDDFELMLKYFCFRHVYLFETLVMRLFETRIEYKYVAQMGIKRGFDGWWGGENGYYTGMDTQMGGGAGMVLDTNPSGRGRGKKLYPPQGWG